ncbi:MAG: gliding motility-associated C-terminal domain-containing protein, partial [Crocinitomicaceae bacterium]|nr:gliding motility-associated C-terminal domain-containing protein [Crocinitomicaceae bacterium]
VSDGNTCAGEIITRTYSITDDCGNQTMVTQQITIEVVTPQIDAGADQSVCDGEAVTLTAGNPNNATISWDNGVFDATSFIPPVGSTTYTVTASECGGQCVSNDQVTVTVNPIPVVSFEGDSLMGCASHEVEFTNNSTEQGNCVWEFGNGVTVNGCGPVSNTYQNAGLYDVTLTVTSSAGCTATETYTDYIEVIPYPVASFSFSPNELDLMNTEVQFENNSLYGNSYLWDFGDLSGGSNAENPTHIYPDNEAGSYEVELMVENAAGCKDSMTVVVDINDVLIFHVPNAITPDGDEFNEEFNPVFASGLDIFDYHLTIFNRWGEIVFESYNVDYGWDGHYGNGGLADDGVYIWQIEFGDTMSDKKHIKRGHVTVLK